jgi:uncharacterized protein YjbJ (UPF0337 family)
MSNEDITGKAENLKGRVKQAAGSLTGDKKLEAEGAVDRVKGAAREKVGEAKRKLDDVAGDDDTEELDENDDDKV